MVMGTGILSPTMEDFTILSGDPVIMVTVFEVPITMDILMLTIPGDGMLAGASAGVATMATDIDIHRIIHMAITTTIIHRITEETSLITQDAETVILMITGTGRSMQTAVSREFRDIPTPEMYAQQEQVLMIAELIKPVLPV